jgi:Domain of unknown function (DUF4760)
MTTYEWLAVVTAGVGLAVNVAVLYVLVRQLGAVRDQIAQARDATVAEHDRRRREATIDFYLATMRRRHELRDYLADDRDREAVAHLIEEVRDDGIDSEKGHAVRDYLNLWESLAVGVETDVYALEIADALTGARIVSIAENYQEFIAWRRDAIEQVGSEEKLYEALERVARRIGAARGSDHADDED